MSSPLDGPVVLVGGSNGSACFAALWSSGALPSGAHEVRVLSRRPERFRGRLVLRELRSEGEGSLLGSSVFARPTEREIRAGPIEAFGYEQIEEALAGASSIWISAPVFAYREILGRILPAAAREADRSGRSARRPLLIGFFYGQGGVDWMAESLSRELLGGPLPESLALCVLKNFPALISRVSEERVESYGYHPDCAFFAPYPRSAGDHAEEAVRALIASAAGERPGSLKRMSAPLLCTLGGSNQVLHPAILGGLIGPAPGRLHPERPRAYRGLPWRSFRLLSILTKEYYLLAEALDRRAGTRIAEELGCTPSLRVLGRLMALDPPDLMLELFGWVAVNSTRRLRAARVPLRETAAGFAIDPSHRFVIDDLPFGLCVAVGLAELIDHPMHGAAALLEELQPYLGKEYVRLVGGRRRLVGQDVGETGAPQAYGVRDLASLRALLLERRLPDRETGVP